MSGLLYVGTLSILNFSLFLQFQCSLCLTLLRVPPSSPAWDIMCVVQHFSFTILFCFVLFCFALFWGGLVGGGKKNKNPIQNQKRASLQNLSFSFSPHIPTSIFARQSHRESESAAGRAAQPFPWDAGTACGAGRGSGPAVLTQAHHQRLQALFSCITARSISSTAYEQMTANFRGWKWSRFICLCLQPKPVTLWKCPTSHSVSFLLNVS